MTHSEINSLELDLCSWHNLKCLGKMMGEKVELFKWVDIHLERDLAYIDDYSHVYMGFRYHHC